MSISYFAALLFLGCIFTTSIGGIFRRQDDECFTPEFSQCVEEANINRSEFNETLQGERNYLEAILSFYCTREDCLSAAIEFNVCSGSGDADYVRRRCTRNDDEEFCEVRFFDGLISGDIPLDFDSCENASRICTTECHGDLTSISSYWGCCTATFTSTTIESMPIPAREIFERCDVPLDEPCSGSNNNNNNNNNNNDNNTRQDDECFTPEFSQCVEEANIDRSEFNETTLQGERNYLEAILSFYCTREDCLSAAIEFNVCSGSGDADYVRRRCTRDDVEEFCEVRFFDGLISGDIPLDFDSCENASRICTTECREDLASISSYWGCCTATFTSATIESMPIPAREIFERCDVPLNYPCSGSYKTPMFFCMIIIAFLIVIII